MFLPDWLIDWLCSRIPVGWVLTSSHFTRGLVSARALVPPFGAWRAQSVYATGREIPSAHAQSALQSTSQCVVQIMWPIPVCVIYARKQDIETGHWNRTLKQDIFPILEFRVYRVPWDIKILLNILIVKKKGIALTSVIY